MEFTVNLYNNETTKLKQVQVTTHMAIVLDSFKMF